MSEMNSDALLAAVKEASSRWKEAFNSGDAAGCAAAYEEDAVMNAAPFGCYKGRGQIEAFWKHLIAEGFSDVEYIDPVLEVLDGNSVLLKSGWRMNKARGIITRELWVLQDDGHALLREDDFEAQG